MRFVRIDLRAVGLALRQWTPRRWVLAAVSAVVVGVVIGLATVLIPNPVFARDIPPVWWNVPVLVLAAVLTGLLTATIVRDRSAEPDVTSDSGGRMGILGTVLAWFVVGCPVCNKIALLALGYSGALTFFAPLQPVLAVLAVLLTGYALLQRLQGEVACPMPRRATRTAGTGAPASAGTSASPATPTTGEVR